MYFPCNLYLYLLWWLCMWQVPKRLVFVPLSIVLGILTGMTVLSMARHSCTELKANLTHLIVPLVYGSFIVAEMLDGSGLIFTHSFNP